jgi:hypothetical protein
MLDFDRNEAPVAKRDDRVIYADRIVQDPAILFGKPVIRGTRIPVYLFRSAEKR